MPKSAFDWPESLATYRKWYDPSQPLADFLYQLGVALLKKGKMQDALCALSNSYRQTPKRPQLPFYLGMAYHQLGDWAQALAYYREALRHEPKAARIYNNIGTIFETLQSFPQALMFYRQAILHDPNHADAFYNIGNLMRRAGQHQEAVSFYRKAIQLKPKFLEAWINMAPLLRQLNELDAALEAYRKILQLDPNNASADHWVAALSCTRPRQNQAESYIRGLFDHYAENYDEHLQTQLQYQAPEHIRKLLDFIPDRPIASCLDLGCGTGLIGEVVCEQVSYLEGWDLSDKMLQKAEKKGIYHKLCKQDLLKPSPDEGQFKLVLCIDVCPYLADLKSLKPCIDAKLEKAGWLILTTEHSENTLAASLPTGRFAHSSEELEDFARLCGLSIVKRELLPLRIQGEQWIEGGFYLLQRCD